MYYGRSVLSKKQFEKEKTKDTVIVGDTKLEEYNEEKHKNCERLQFDDKKYVVKPKMCGFTQRYIRVGLDEYIAVKVSAFLFILLFAFLIGGGLLLVFTAGRNIDKPDTENTEEVPIDTNEEDISEYEEPSNSTQETIEIPGLRSQYNLSSKNMEIYLINPEGNSVRFKYTLYCNGEEILTTDYINPNKMVKANLYNLLPKGTYDIDIKITTKDIATDAVCNGASLNTRVVIKK